MPPKYGHSSFPVHYNWRRWLCANYAPYFGAPGGDVYKLIIRPIARRQTAQKPTLSRVNMMQSDSGR